MKLRTYRGCPTGLALPPAVATSDGADAEPAGLPGAVRALGVLLLIAGLTAGLAHLAGRAIGQAAGAAAAAPRDAHLIESMHYQIALMRERGLIADIYDGHPGGQPTVVVVTDRYLATAGSLAEELPLYGGHFVGFADEYAWLVNGHHDVRLVREDGTEIGRRTGEVSDAQVRETYKRNLDRLNAAAAGSPTAVPMTNK